MPEPSDHYPQLTAFITDFIATHEPVPVDGAIYDLPGTIVYQTHTQPLAGKGRTKGRLEVNVVTPEATDVFEWSIEITLNDKASGRFIHAIVRRDGSVVETYGKTVLPVSGLRADEILAALAASR